MAMTLQDKLRAGRFVITAEVTPPVSSDPATNCSPRPSRSRAWPTPSTSPTAPARGRISARVTAAAMLVEAGHRAGAAAHLPRPQPHRPAERPDQRGGVRRAQSAHAARRRSERRRSARRQAGVRSRSAPAAGNRAAPCATAANCRRGRKVTGRCDFFLGAADNPIDPPPGWDAERPRRQASPPARNSCRRSSAWTPAWCAATWRGWPSTAWPTSLPSLIGIVPLRSAKSARWIKDKLYGAIIPDAMIARMEAARDPGGGRPPHLSRDRARTCRNPERRRRPHHGARQRRRGAGVIIAAAARQGVTRRLGSCRACQRSSRAHRLEQSRTCFSAIPRVMNTTRLCAARRPARPPARPADARDAARTAPPPGLGSPRH